MTEFILTNALEADGLEPSIPTVEGDLSRARKLFATQSSNMAVNTWHAVPGTYSHGGGGDGETFFVLTGAADLSVDGAPDVPLRAGSVVSIPPNTPSQMKVTEELCKVSLSLW